ncbi:hypothetical protein WR25_14181 [Diploscapter pachys]|uniref:PDZ domain-containing protein n=1 Tax=Diploscapter pachys TaxID=2018661 RepID=A0A2A2KUJ1_9BILA|nr:hypothetical protein WR25_14181 [Diploscapter pachys]
MPRPREAAPLYCKPHNSPVAFVHESSLIELLICRFAEEERVRTLINQLRGRVECESVRDDLEKLDKVLSDPLFRQHRRKSRERAVVSQRSPEVQQLIDHLKGTAEEQLRATLKSTQRLVFTDIDASQFVPEVIEEKDFVTGSIRLLIAGPKDIKAKVSLLFASVLAQTRRPDFDFFAASRSPALFRIILALFLCYIPRFNELKTALPLCACALCLPSYYSLLKRSHSRLRIGDRVLLLASYFSPEFFNAFDAVDKQPVTRTEQRQQEPFTTTPSLANFNQLVSQKDNSPVVVACLRESTAMVTRTGAAVVSSGVVGSSAGSPRRRHGPLSGDWIQVEVVRLSTEGGGLGFGIVGGTSTGVVVKTILPGSPAHQDGRLQAGDHILQVGNVNTHGMSSQQVAQLLRQQTKMVEMIVGRPISQADRPPDTKDCWTMSTRAALCAAKLEETIQRQQSMAIQETTSKAEEKSAITEPIPEDEPMETAQAQGQQEQPAAATSRQGQSLD